MSDTTTATATSGAPVPTPTVPVAAPAPAAAPPAPTNTAADLLPDIKAAIAAVLPKPAAETTDAAAPPVPPNPDARTTKAPTPAEMDAAAKAGTDTAEPTGTTDPAAGAGDAAADATAEPAATDAAKPARFQVRGENGEFVEAPPIKITFKADGKVFQDVPLDKVVELAQAGRYNHRLQKQVNATLEYVPQLESAVQERDSLIERLATELRDVLSSEDNYVTRRAKWIEENTPDKVIERLASENEALRTRGEQERTVGEAQQFIVSTVQPVLTSLYTQYPTVTPDEVADRVGRLLRPLEVRGTIPLSKRADVMRVLEHELTPWVAQLHTDRQSTATALRAAEAEKARAREAQEAAQRKVNETARPLRPAGSPAPDRAPPVSITSANDPAQLHALVREAVATYVPRSA